jgi:hypothetical protein
VLLDEGQAKISLTIGGAGSTGNFLPGSGVNVFEFGEVPLPPSESLAE